MSLRVSCLSCISVRYTKPLHVILNFFRMKSQIFTLDATKAYKTKHLENMSVSTYFEAYMVIQSHFSAMLPSLCANVILFLGDDIYVQCPSQKLLRNDSYGVYRFYYARR